MTNVVYKTKRLVSYFSTHRCRWEQFYPSERKVIEHVAPQASWKVLDMGCACGGLGAALKERFSITAYTGVEINEDCARAAIDVCPTGRVIHGDFLQAGEALPADFDLAFSLSCADWNVRTDELMRALFRHVKPGGWLVFSFRLSNEPSATGVWSAQQTITYGVEGEDSQQTELAPYKVYTLGATMALLKSMGPMDKIYGYGYWGDTPASVTGLPLKRIHYAVFAVWKATTPEAEPKVTLEFSPDFQP